MSFVFSRFVKGGESDLIAEKRLKALSGYAMYVGQALKVTAGRLMYVQTSGDRVYAISNTSAASSVLTADYVPEVFPVNKNQVWQGTFSTAVTAAVAIANTMVEIDTSSNGTGIAGDIVGTGAVLYDLVTGTSLPGATSAAFVIFKGVFD